MQTEQCNKGFTALDSCDDSAIRPVRAVCQVRSVCCKTKCPVMDTLLTIALGLLSPDPSTRTTVQEALQLLQEAPSGA